MVWIKIHTYKGKLRSHTHDCGCQDLTMANFRIHTYNGHSRDSYIHYQDRRFTYRGAKCRKVCTGHTKTRTGKGCMTSLLLNSTTGLAARCSYNHTASPKHFAHQTLEGALYSSYTHTVVCVPSSQQAAVAMIICRFTTGLQTRFVEHSMARQDLPCFPRGRDLKVVLMC